jgi:hypothetical protein
MKRTLPFLLLLLPISYPAENNNHLTHGIQPRSFLFKNKDESIVKRKMYTKKLALKIKKTFEEDDFKDEIEILNKEHPNTNLLLNLIKEEEEEKK